MLKDRSLNFKLRLSFFVLIILFVIVGSMNVYSLHKTSEKYDHIAKVNLINAITISDMGNSSREVFRRLLQLQLRNNSAEDIARIEKSIADNLANYDKNRQKYEGVHFVAGEKEIYTDVSNNWTELIKIFPHAVELSKKSDESGRDQFSKLYHGELKKPRDSFFKALDSLLVFQKNEAEKWSQAAEETSGLSYRLTFMAVAIGVILAGIIGMMISKNLTTQLKGIINHLTSGAAVVFKTSEEIAKSSEDLSSSVNEQAAAIQETTASAEELSAMVKKNEDSARYSSEVSAKSSEAASTGKKSVENMISAIGEIHTNNQSMMISVENNNKNIAEIIQVIQEIASKTNVINDIVFQTKLLSFNASVEAARAGEQGKGFAVVAEEVGNLAQMSGNAAKEITDLLQASTKKVEQIVSDSKREIEKIMVMSTEKVNNGIAVAQNCDVVLDQIVIHVKDVDHMVSEIAVASSEQSKGIAEITRAMTQLEQATHANADSSRQAAHSSENLSIEAKKLNELVLDLRETVEGKTEQRV